MPKAGSTSFVEADRGTMTLKRFSSKLKAYAEYWKQKRHIDKLKIKRFRVLTVTASDTRRKNLIRAAAAEDAIRSLGPLFLFATEKDLPLSRPENVFTKIWLAPAREEPCSIF